MKKLPMAVCAEVCDLGALVSWSGAEGDTVGVVTELIQGGKQLRVRFKGGDERIFVATGRAIERLFFEPGDPVQVASSGTIGVAVEARQVGRKIQYKVSFPGNVVKAVSEGGLRPAVLTNPVERLRTGAVGNPRRFALRSTAARYAFANRYDEFTSLDNSRIEAKPHQISVAHRVVSAYPHRFLLCDEVGLGKTIEAGMVLKELRARGVAKRVLILVPTSLLSQWQFELKTKFNESFAIYNGASTKWLKQTSDENVWTLNDSIIASHGFASYSEERIGEISGVDWDVVIVDEAHHARVYHSGSSTHVTWLYRLVERLADFKMGGRRSFLLLTATPMQLDPRELYRLVELIDPALFPRVEDFEEQRGILRELNTLVAAIGSYEDPEKASSLLRQGGGGAALTLASQDLREELARRVEAVLTERPSADGEALSLNGGGHESIAELLDSRRERERLAEEVRSRHLLSEVLIRNRKNKVGGFQHRQAFSWPVDQTDEESETYAAVADYVREGYQRALETQNNALGFVMVTFQKLMASSSRALRTSLRGRRQRLADKISGQGNGHDFEEPDVADEEVAAPLVERASAQNREFVSPEELLHLDELVSRLERIGTDSKATVLVERMQKIFSQEPRGKVLIFTQFRETQQMLAELLGERWSVYVFHGGLGVHEKDKAIADFRADPGPAFLVSTEAGGEGRNLQFCHLLVNYDLPWNPMRVEQRIGRVDRIGQKSTVSIFNFSVKGTIEERVLDVLERRIGLFEQTVGGLDPILGEVETDLRRIFRMAAAQAERALKKMSGDLERRVEAARKADSQLADFIMDARSFQPEIARQIIGEEGDVDHRGMTRFVRALLKDRKTYIGLSHDGVYEIVFHEPLLSDFPELVKAGGDRRVACFEPNVAREREDVEFFTFGHPIVDALVERVMGGGYDGMAAVRHVRNSGLPAADGYQFDFVLEIGGVNPRKEVLSVFVHQDGRVDEDLARRLVEIGASFDDERGDEEDAAGVPEALDQAYASADEAAALALDGLMSGLVEKNWENLRRERKKLERYFDYRVIAASDKVAHAGSVVGRLEASDEPSDQKILPVWRSNLERAIQVEEGLEEDRKRMLSELDLNSESEASYSMYGVARVFVHPDYEEGPS